MSVEIKGDITTIIEKYSKGQEPNIVIWTIGKNPINTSDIDSALEKVFIGRYSEFTKNKKSTVVPEKRIL